MYLLVRFGNAMHGGRPHRQELVVHRGHSATKGSLPLVTTSAAPVEPRPPQFERDGGQQSLAVLRRTSRQMFGNVEMDPVMPLWRIALVGSASPSHRSANVRAVFADTGYGPRTDSPVRW